MPKIAILKKDETDSGWKFAVDVDGTKFEVEADKDYLQKISGGREDAESLVVRSFEFLLQREPKESILRRFNLRDIETYFPEYPGKL